MSASHNSAHVHPVGDHHTDHPPPSGHDYVAANANHFNEHADEFEAHPFAKEGTERQTIAFLGAYPFDWQKTIMMDFACGPGLVSRELSSYTKQIVGVDISQGLVENFNKYVKGKGISAEDMKAVCVHLKGEDGELDGMKFDIIICGMAYHHILNLSETTKILAFFLKPGGVLLVTDMLKEDGVMPEFSTADAPKDWEHVVAHKGGFKQEVLRSVLESAGLSVEMNMLPRAKHHTFPAKLILVKGTKAA